MRPRGVPISNIYEGLPERSLCERRRAPRDPAPLAELETLSLYHQSGAAPGLLRLCTFQLGLGGYARLRFLEITCPTYSDQFGRAARRSAVGNDSALYGFVDAALRQEASGSTPSPPLPSLEDLRLTDGRICGICGSIREENHL